MSRVPTDMRPSEANRQLNEREYAARATVLRSRPVSISIETSALCNLKCVMCPRTGPTWDRDGFIGEDILAKIEGFLPFALHLQLHGVGEPLLSPAFWRMLDLIRNHGIAFSEVNSNGLLLDDNRIERLVDSDLSLINISLDAATPETYRRIRGGDFAKVLDNIRRLRSRRDGHGRRLPKIVINMTLMVENIKELPAFVDLACDLDIDGVQAWHLAKGTLSGNDDSWRTTRDGWTFIYPEQHLSNSPALCNVMVSAALALAAKKGMPFVQGTDLHLPV